MDAGRDGQRLDNFLLNALSGVPRSVVYRLCRTGEVRVNGGRVKPSRRLVAGDEVRIPPVRLEPAKTRRVPDSVTTQLEQAIVFEDDDILVLNKPSGLAVHAGSEQPFGVIEALRQLRADTEQELDLVHRLDRDTSGCLLIAKHAQANRELKQQLAARDVEKRYAALVVGRWPRTLTRIENTLGKNQLRGGERVSGRAEQGRHAITHIQVVESGRLCTRLDVRIETGRTHQIRVHTSESGHPVVGDSKYGRHDANRRFAAAGHRGMHLHSAQIAFQWRGERTFEVPAPESWHEAVQL